MPARRDDGPVTLSDTFYRNPQPLQSSALSLFMEPHEIASIPGLPAYAYKGTGAAGLENYADQRVRQDVEKANELPHSVPLPSLGDNQPPSGEKYQRAAHSLGIFGHVMDGWNLQNRAVDRVLRSGMAERLGKVVEKGNRVIEPIKNGLGAAAEMSNGAPAWPTVPAAGIKTASGIGVGMLGGALGGALAGAALGSSAGPIGAVVGGIAGGVLSDGVLGDNNRRIGEEAQRLLGDAGGFYSKYVLDNPYYDPRLAAIP